MAEDVRELLERYNRMKSDRSVFESHWEEVAAFCSPRRLGFTGPRTPGEKRNRIIYNPIGTQCVQTLAAAMHGMTMNPATRWMALRMVNDEMNEDDSIRGWLDDATKAIMTALQSPQTAFHVHANQVLEDLASIGSACMYIGQKKNGALYVRSYSVAEVMISEDQYGSIDTVMRETEYTVRQLIQQFGDKASPRTRKLFDQSKYEEKVRVCHVVKPREDFDRTKKSPDQLPFASVYFEVEGEHINQEGGVEEQPYVAPRWTVSCGEIYGRSPAMSALPDIKLANAAQKTLIEAAEKAVNPPLQVPHEGIASPVRTTPGGLTFVRGKNEIQQMPTSSSLPFAADWVQAKNNEIRTTMFVDAIQFTGDFKMTATEVVQRSTERMRLLGPVLGRLENEFLNPLVNRVFGLMARIDALPRPPKGIEEEELRVEYVSPLARAQKSQLAQSFQMAMATLQPLLEGPPEVAQAVLAPIDMSKLTPLTFEWYGVDTDLLKKDDAMEQEGKQAKMRQALEMLPDLMAAFQSGGAGAEHLANAGRAVMEPIPATGEPGTAEPSSGGGGAGVAPVTPPPGVNLATIMGQMAGNARQNIPPAIGTRRELTEAAR